MGGSDPGAAGFSMQDFINQVGMNRINEAVRRIFTVKFKLGIFENPYGDPVNGPDEWYTPQNEAIAINAAKQAITLLENNGVLPLNLGAGQNLLVTGSRANDGNSYGIWTSYFHRDYGAITMWEAIQEKASSKGINAYLDNAPNPSAAVIIVGEPSYTHRTAWEKEMPWIHNAYFEISDTYEYDLSTIQQVDAMGIPYIVVVVIPRPYILTDIRDMCDALVLAYRPGDGGGPALSDVLFGDFAPQGRLPWQLPRSMDQIGTDIVSGQIEKWDLPFDLGATAAERQEIRSLIANHEQPLPIYGDPLYQYGYGIQGYVKDNERVSESLSAINDSHPRLIVEPNPVNDNLRLHLEGVNPIGKTITIFDLQGRKIMEENITSYTGVLQISVSALRSGPYFIMVEDRGKIYYSLFIKQ